MARRTITSAPNERDALELPAELAHFDVDAWISDDELARIDHLIANTRGPTDRAYDVGIRAYRNWHRALLEWADSAGVARSDLASLISRARHVALTRAQE